MDQKHHKNKIYCFFYSDFSNVAADQVLEAHDGPEDGDPDAKDDDGPVLDLDPGGTICQPRQVKEALFH